MASTVIRPPANILEYPQERQELIVRQGIPGRWKTGERDAITGWASDAGLIRDNALYRKVGCSSWAEYCAEYLQETPASIDPVISGVRQLIREKGWKDYSETEARSAEATMAKVKPQPPTGTNQHTAGLDDVQPTKGGNSASYLAARIKRDHPEVAEAVMRGEYRSIRQAAIAAGIAKRTITVPVEPEAFARAAERHFSPDDRRWISRMLEAGL